MRNRAIDLIDLLQELVARHGEDIEVAVAVDLSRRDVTGLAVDQEIREDDEPKAAGPPLVWLITDTPEGGCGPPRRASTSHLSSPGT